MENSTIAARPYECLFICPSDTSQATVDAFVEKIKKSIAATNGTFRGVQIWGRRRFTYPIKRHKEGLYVYLDFNGEKSTAKELNEIFRVSDLVIRHLTVDRVDRVERKPPATPSATPDSTKEPVASPTGTTKEPPSIKKEA